MKNKNIHKGIILAGGEGTRLHPLTKVISKQMLPVYDQPMIFYPLKTLINSGIKEILIITRPDDLDDFKALIGNGSDYGISIDYIAQKRPEGIAQAFILGEQWLNTSPTVLILGDNLFLNGNVSNIIIKSLKLNKGATIFGFNVNDPERYGVVEFDDKKNVISIEEKPNNPKSNWAVTGLYIYDNNVCNYAKDLRPSKRGELEITDLNKFYLKNKQLKINLLDKNSFWLDAGTKDSLLDASNIVRDLKEKKVKIY